MYQKTPAKLAEFTLDINRIPADLIFNIEGKIPNFEPLSEELILTKDKYDDLIQKIIEGLRVPKEVFVVDSVSN